MQVHGPLHDRLEELKLLPLLLLLCLPDSGFARSQIRPKPKGGSKNMVLRSVPRTKDKKILEHLASSRCEHGFGEV